ncbi:UNVERIFIED_CONTAM: hypothetical protein Scaly_2116100 [Sesamum calycinum]|uniref:Uncharacterized protein n=1 Tax=Sesamum calycinum TaxID=2727403 RepID=A0AAW2MM78_9LAMI
MDPQLAVRQPHSSQKRIDIDVQMLQREIMFKQLKELHGRHQLQELGDTRNQDYVNQLSSLKQASAVQFAPRVNRAPVHNSQMFTAGNMQMMQRDGSGILQQLSNGLILSQSHNHALGPMGVSLPESDINLNLYSHLQGRSNHSATLLTKNDNSPLDISAMHPSAFASSLISYESRGTLWLHRSTSNSVSNGIHQPFNQVKQLNIQRYSVESEKMVPGDNVEPMSDLLGASAVSQHFELPTALSTSWPYITTQEDVPSPKPSRCSANLFHSPDSASCIQEASSGAPNEQHDQKCPGNKRNIQEFGTCSGKSEYHELPLERSFSLHEDSTELHNPISVSRTTHRQESFRMHQSEADRVAAGSMMSCTFQQPSNHAKQKDNGTPVLPVRDIRAFAHSLHQNYSLLHQMHSREAAYQQAITNGRELLLSGEKLAVNDKAKSDLAEVQLGAISLGDQSGKALSASPPNFQQKEMFNQNGSESCSNSNEVSNVAYQSLISLQMAPSWCKQYGTLNNGQMWPMYIPKPAINAGQPFSGLTVGKLQENSFIMQVTSANTSQGSGELQSSASTVIANKHLSPSSMLSSDVYQDLALPKPKKRKSVAFDMVPWNKEVNEEPLRLQNISISELEWAEASNIRPQEAQKEAEIVEEVFPVVRAKRRLIFTTQIMQQVFRPAPVVILLGDARSNCDYVAYSAGRLALGDACNWTNKLPSDTKNASPDKPKTSRRISACDLSKAVEGLISRVAKLESDLSRLDRSLSIVDIKIESQEVEKFSTYNRFAKFHVKAGPSTVDPASSSGPSTVQKRRPQPYVIALPMPGTIPEGSDCLSL